MICSYVCLFRCIVRSPQKPNANSIWINPQGNVTLSNKQRVGSWRIGPLFLSIVVVCTVAISCCPARFGVGIVTVRQFETGRTNLAAQPLML